MQRFWFLNLIRGIVALIVGVLILAWPDVGGKLFVNFLAVFWLVSGVMILQWGVTMHQRRGLWLVAGIVGTVVGVALLLRYFYQRYLDPANAVRILGALALFVGLINVFGGFRTPNMAREESTGRVILGGFEVGLGVLLIIIDALGPVSKLLAGGWAFVGGIVLILQAVQMRRAEKVKPAS
ncbi:MAG TPA: DUF308 domain-containing protein [Ktedonobacteraceae bacterium]|nr:DUF308 domain-containing protein [Ktedonobacteraceae bacterium]